MNASNTPGAQVERVLFIAPEMEPRGTSECTVNLASELKRRGVSATVFCVPGPMLEVLEKRQIAVETFERLESIWFAFTERKALLAAVSRFSPQVIHGQTVRVARVLTSLARAAAAPIVLTAHWPPSKPRAFRALAARMSGIIATSQDVREELVNKSRVSKDKIAVIPNGIDIDSLAGRHIRPIFSDVEPVVGSVGPVEKGRGHELFLHAASRLVRSGKRLQFVVAGGGHELPALRKLAATLGLDNYLTFVADFASYDEILSALDVVVQSSLVNVSGFSILEAMGHGRPVIAFNTGTACEIIEDEKTGILVPREDVNKLAHAIERLTEDAARAAEMGQAARATVAEKFNIRRVADVTLSFYAQLVSAYQVSPSERGGG